MNKFCPNCGKEVAEGSQFCDNCGAQINAGQPTQAPAGQQFQQVPPVGTAPKSKLCAGLLAIFLGSLGIHNFYLGYTGKAIAELLLTLLTCGFGGLISGIWALWSSISTIKLTDVSFFCYFFSQ